MKQLIVLPGMPRLCGSLGQPCKRTDSVVSHHVVGSRCKVLIQISCDSGIGGTELHQGGKEIGVVYVGELSLQQTARRNIELNVREDLVVGGAHVFILRLVIPKASSQQLLFFVRGEQVTIADKLLLVRDEGLFT